MRDLLNILDQLMECAETQSLSEPLSIPLRYAMGPEENIFTLGNSRLAVAAFIFYSDTSALEGNES